MAVSLGFLVKSRVKYGHSLHETCPAEDLMDQQPDPGIGARVRELRRARGLKQQDLAYGEISISYVSLIESGKRVPSETVLVSLAERLNCSVEYLRSGKDDNRTVDLKIKIAFADIAMRNGSNGEALQAYSEALASAPLLDAELARRARIGQAYTMEKLGRLEAAIQLMTDLFEEPESVPGSSEWIQLAVAICRCYRHAGDFNLSIEVGERALKRLSTLGLDATDDHIQLGASLVASYQRRGDLTQAHLLAERLIQLAEREGTAVGRASIYWNAAVVARSRGFAREALALVERALALMSESDSERHIGQLRSFYGRLLTLRGHEGDLDRAGQLLEQAQAALVEVGTADDQANVELILAELKLQSHEYRKAQEHASRSIGLLRNQPVTQTVEARAALAEARFGQGDAELATETLHAAVEQLRAVAPSWTSAQVWRRVADLWIKFGMPDRAIAAYDQALTDAGIAPVVPTVATVNAVMR
jgi:tetratricopeptide (TPR) repeat protein